MNVMTAHRQWQEKERHIFHIEYLLKTQKDKQNKNISRVFDCNMINAQHNITYINECSRSMNNGIPRQNETITKEKKRKR